MTTTRKVIIIGSGPAAYTAAIYAARANLAPLQFIGLQPGGQLMLTTLVENYPGFVEGIDGPPLMETFKKQAERFGTEMITEDVTAVDFARRPFTVSAGGESWEALTVIVATGAVAKLLGLENESVLMGRGVSTCATCDGFFFKDQNVMVVGGGDSAVEEALYLARLGRKVEVMQFAGSASLKPSLRKILDWGAEAVVVHLGAKGAGYYSRAGWVTAPAALVRP